MKRKGISPLIAAVLLIAFTMAVASLFAQWAPQLIKSAQGETKNKSAEIQRCSGIVLEIQQHDYDNVTVQQTGGDDPAGNLTATWFFTDGTNPIQGYPDPGDTINTKRGVTTITNPPGGAGANALDRVEVVPTDCEGTSPAIAP